MTLFLGQIFSRHEAVLASHREMLDSVKGHIEPDGEAFRAVSVMLNKTVQAMNQSNVMRKHMVSLRFPWCPSKDSRLT